VESCGENRAERRAQARKNRPLVEFRHRMARRAAKNVGVPKPAPPAGAPLTAPTLRD
jgi:hypothetical protein